MEDRTAGLLNPLQLAYMGDAVWEIVVRSRLIHQQKSVRHMHTECVQSVNAAAQARNLEKILPLLTEEEKAVVLRGRNAHSRHPAPRHQNPADYSEATGFEALLGYLYLTERYDRIHEIQETIFYEEAADGA